jgi:hypothetical protein
MRRCWRKTKRGKPFAAKSVASMLAYRRRNPLLAFTCVILCATSLLSDAITRVAVQKKRVQRAPRSRTGSEGVKQLPGEPEGRRPDDLRAALAGEEFVR